MHIIRNLNQIKSALPDLALAIGNFDGVHLGHEAIINEVKKIAKEKNIFSAILTFEPHPKAFFQPNRAKDFRIDNLSKKLALFKKYKIDYAIILPFNQSLADIEARDFVRNILSQSLSVQNLIVGYDFVFGKNRKGTFQLLEEKSKILHFDLTEISALRHSEEVCSSSIIRKLIWEGNMLQANRFLGRNFSVSGIVNEGRKLAGQLGFPTANILSKPHIIKPKFGVYKTSTFIPELNKNFASITNFGIKPTVQDTKIPLYETHIPNFNQNIYGKKIEIEFLDFIRDEMKFASLDALKKQITADISAL